MAALKAVFDAPRHAGTLQDTRTNHPYYPELFATLAQETVSRLYCPAAIRSTHAEEVGRQISSRFVLTPIPTRDYRDTRKH